LYTACRRTLSDAASHEVNYIITFPSWNFIILRILLQVLCLVFGLQFTTFIQYPTITPKGGFSY
jgi:hypothetical protein